MIPPMWPLLLMAQCVASFQSGGPLLDTLCANDWMVTGTAPGMTVQGNPSVLGKRGAVGAALCVCVCLSALLLYVIKHGCGIGIGIWSDVQVISPHIATARGPPRPSAQGTFVFLLSLSWPKVST